MGDADSHNNVLQVHHALVRVVGAGTGQRGGVHWLVGADVPGQEDKAVCDGEDSESPVGWGNQESKTMGMCRGATGCDSWGPATLSEVILHCNTTVPFSTTCPHRQPARGGFR